MMTSIFTKFLESDKTVRRTDGTMIYQSGQSLANSFSSMVVQENHSGGNNSFANFINSQDRSAYFKMDFRGLQGLSTVVLVSTVALSCFIKILQSFS